MERGDRERLVKRNLRTAFSLWIDTFYPDIEIDDDEGWAELAMAVVRELGIDDLVGIK